MVNDRRVERALGKFGKRKIPKSKTVLLVTTSDQPTKSKTVLLLRASD
jgi:hypothetical protein